MGKEGIKAYFIKMRIGQGRMLDILGEINVVGKLELDKKITK